MELERRGASSELLFLRQLPRPVALLYDLYYIFHCSAGYPCSFHYLVRDFHRWVEQLLQGRAQTKEAGGVCMGKLPHQIRQFRK